MVRERCTSDVRRAFGLAGLALIATACTGGCESATTKDTTNATYETPTIQKTTTSAIALKNLDEGIQRAAIRGDRASEIALLLQRTQFLGTYDDLDRADALSLEAIERSSNDTTKMLRATVLARLHRFREALEVLETVEAPTTTESLRQRATIVAAQGAADEARAMLTAAGYPRGAMHELGTWAVVQAAAGDFVAADNDYRGALASYRDVSPMPAASTLFAMGVMWSERAGNADRGVMLYRAAVERLPEFVTANVHLAEIEAAEGDLDGAIARLEGLNANRDPEPSSRLAEWYDAKGDTARADEHRKAALEGYETLLGRHRAAFADHAAEFFLGAGRDATRALALARDNLNERRTARAYGLVIRAADAAGDRALACATATEAFERHPGAVELEGLDCPNR